MPPQPSPPDTRSELCRSRLLRPVPCPSTSTPAFTIITITKCFVFCRTPTRKRNLSLHLEVPRVCRAQAWLFSALDRGLKWVGRCFIHPRLHKKPPLGAGLHVYYTHLQNEQCTGCDVTDTLRHIADGWRRLGGRPSPHHSKPTLPPYTPTPSYSKLTPRLLLFLSPIILI